MAEKFRKVAQYPNGFNKIAIRVGNVAAEPWTRTSIEYGVWSMEYREKEKEILTKAIRAGLCSVGRSYSTEVGFVANHRRGLS
ncbi:hypothetical protein KQX54_008075 [Cotesia glomerata]|uniref:Uncharacterized protein n=1 Tax=Cotesia glomerata TaxID=32391 RepID=A0AAV7IGJ9_COTGL|nr:hypothetical protein KQX54_008075 [Cotesia glomerata]